MRAAIIAGLMLLLLHGMGAISPPGSRRPLRITGAERALLAIIILLFLTVIPWSLARSFINDHPEQREFARAEIYVPYIPYFFYMVGLWVGIVTPAFLFLIRAARADKCSLASRWKTISRLANQAPLVESRKALRHFRELRTALDDYVLLIRLVAQRYFCIIFLVAVALMVEHAFFSLNSTVTKHSVELAKIGSWILLGPTLVIAIVFTVKRYQEAVDATIQALGRQLSEAPPTEGDDELYRLRSELIWDRGIGRFLLSMFHGTTMTMAFIFAFTLYFAPQLISGEDFVSVLFPKFLYGWIPKP